MRRNRSLFLSLLILSSGCFRYVPARIGAVPEGSAVRLHVSPEGASRVEPVIGSASPELVGVLERWSDQVVIAVRVPAGQGVVDRALENRIVLSPSEVIAIEVRERDRARTIALAAGGVAVLGGATVAALTGVFGGSSNNDPPVEEDARVPFSIFARVPISTIARVPVSTIARVPITILGRIPVWK
jgi:hypothetical protein